MFGKPKTVEAMEGARAQLPMAMAETVVATDSSQLLSRSMTRVLSAAAAAVEV
jgi:hypothetical protein